MSMKPGEGRDGGFAEREAAAAAPFEEHAAGRHRDRAVDVFPDEPAVVAPGEKFQLTSAGRRWRIGEIFKLLRKYEVWNDITPVRLRCLLEELGPMFVKMGQILANRSEILPQRFCDELGKLRTDVDPVPFDTIRECLAAE